MATEESEKKGASESMGTDIQIPKYAWPITGVVVILVIGAIIYFTMGKYDHISKGQFVGPGKCRECHKEQYDSWKKTRMANSFNVLRPGVNAKEKQMVGIDPDKDYTHDETCLPCHTTGYGLVGGFVSIEKTPEMAGVSCEACHGHGGSYVNTVMSPKNPRFKTPMPGMQDWYIHRLRMYAGNVTMHAAPLSDWIISFITVIVSSLAPMSTTT